MCPCWLPVWLRTLGHPLPRRPAADRPARFASPRKPSMITPPPIARSTAGRCSPRCSPGSARTPHEPPTAPPGPPRPSPVPVTGNDSLAVLNHAIDALARPRTPAAHPGQPHRPGQQLLPRPSATPATRIHREQLTWMVGFLLSGVGLFPYTDGQCKGPMKMGNPVAFRGKAAGVVADRHLSGG
jgi:hypothetical protein